MASSDRVDILSCLPPEVADMILGYFCPELGDLVSASRVSRGWEEMVGRSLLRHRDHSHPYHPPPGETPAAAVRGLRAVWAKFSGFRAREAVSLPLYGNSRDPQIMTEGEGYLAIGSNGVRMNFLRYTEGRYTSEITVWRVTDRSLIHTFTDVFHDGSAIRQMIIKDGVLGALGKGGKAMHVLLWDLTTGRQIRSLSRPDCHMGDTEPTVDKAFHFSVTHDVIALTYFDITDDDLCSAELVSIATGETLHIFRAINFGMFTCRDVYLVTAHARYSYFLLWDRYSEVSVWKISSIGHSVLGESWLHVPRKHRLRMLHGGQVYYFTCAKIDVNSHMFQAAYHQVEFNFSTAGTEDEISQCLVIHDTAKRLEVKLSPNANKFWPDFDFGETFGYVKYFINDLLDGCQYEIFSLKKSKTDDNLLIKKKCLAIIDCEEEFMGTTEICQLGTKKSLLSHEFLGAAGFDGTNQSRIFTAELMWFKSQPNEKFGVTEDAHEYSVRIRV